MGEEYNLPGEEELSGIRIGRQHAVVARSWRGARSDLSPFTPHPLRRDVGAVFKSAGLYSTLNYSAVVAASALESVSPERGRRTDVAIGRKRLVPAPNELDMAGCKVARGKVAGG